MEIKLKNRYKTETLNGDGINDGTKGNYADGLNTIADEDGYIEEFGKKTILKEIENEVKNV